MEVQKDIALIKARYDAVNAHDFDRFQGFYAPSIVWNDPGLRAPIRGARQVRKRLETLVAAFPDLQWKLETIFAQNGQVCAEFTFTGTHKGPLRVNNGPKVIAPTNKRIRIQACGIYVIKKGKITESRVYFDYGSIFQKAN